MVSICATGFDFPKMGAAPPMCFAREMHHTPYSIPLIKSNDQNKRQTIERSHSLSFTHDQDLLTPVEVWIRLKTRDDPGFVLFKTLYVSPTGPIILMGL